MSEVHLPPGAAPADLEIEKALLGCIFLDSRCLDDVALILVADDFYLEQNQILYAACLHMHGENLTIDPLTVSDALEKAGTLATAGGQDYMIQCLESVPHAAHAQYYAKLVAEKSQRRKLSYAGTDTVERSRNLSLTVEEAVGQSEQEIHRILERQTNQAVQPIGDILAEVIGRIGSERVSGLPTRMPSVDKLLCGMSPGNLIILAARPSMGKTSWAGNLAVRAAANGDAVGFISLEQGKVELADRLLCAEAKIPMQTARAGGLTEDQCDQLLKAAHFLGQYPLLIDDSTSRGIAAIEASARLMVRRHGIKLLIVDYLQLISGQERRDIREQEIAEVTRRLKGLAKSLSIPVLALAQINRAVESRDDKHPRLSDLRESGAIEQDADIVMFLYREEVYSPDDPDAKGIAELIVAKHRNGETGTVKLQFDKALMQFNELAAGHLIGAEPMPFDSGEYGGGF